jgi:MFS family permease
MTGYSIVAALLPQFIDAWSLTNAQGGWLAGMVFAGYMLGVLPLVGLTDHLPARVICLAPSAFNALSCFGVVLSDDLFAALRSRDVAGIALAGMISVAVMIQTHGPDSGHRCGRRSDQPAARIAVEGPRPSPGFAAVSIGIERKATCRPVIDDAPARPSRPG